MKRIWPQSNGSGAKDPPQPPRRDSEDGDDPDVMEVNDPNNSDPVASIGSTTQDIKKRREIRHAYRDIQSHLDDHQHELEAPESTGLHDQLNKLEEIFDQVQHTREAALDSALLYKIAESGKRQALALHTDFLQFEPTDFADRLLNFLDQYKEGQDTVTHVSTEAWEKLGDAVQTFFARSPPLHFMYGSFERGPPKRKVRKERPPKDKEDDTLKPSAPRAISRFSKTSKTETTTEEVDLVHRQLKECYSYWNNEPICFFQFVVNPTSFAQTIENIFHVAFLVKDGLAKITLDETKLPVICPIQKREGQDVQTDSPRQQFIMTLTKKEWQEIVETFDMSQPQIPARERVTAAAENGYDDDDSENRERGEPAPNTSTNSRRRRRN